jgi:hypothetical protein
MLGGIAPIIIFQFKKLTPSAQESLSKIPIVSSIVNAIGLPPIPLYLSEELTGLFIDTEEKNIDIETTVESTSDGTDPKTKQKSIGSTVRVNIKARANSIGLTLLNAMADLILPKVTSQEYSITYLNGSTTIFGGLLHSYAVQASSENDLLMITIEFSKTTQLSPAKTAVPEVSATGIGGIDANSVNNVPLTAASPPVPIPPSIPVPAVAPPPVALDGLK